MSQPAKSLDLAATPDEYPARLDRARSIWDGRAAEWDVRAEESARSVARAAELERVAAALRLEPGVRVLDAGCGSGQWALALAERGCRVTAIDLSPAMIERARAHAAERGLAVEWRVGDLTRLAAPDGAFDAALARVSLQFVPDPAGALRELRRVLRPGGRLLATVPGALSPIYRNVWRRFLDGDDLATNRLVPWELAALLGEIGFDIVEEWGEYGAIASGEANPFDPAQLADLPLPLRQAAATTWTMIGDRGQGAGGRDADGQAARRTDGQG